MMSIKSVKILNLQNIQIKYVNEFIIIKLNLIIIKFNLINIYYRNNIYYE